MKSTKERDSRMHLRAKKGHMSLGGEQNSFVAHSIACEQAGIDPQISVGAGTACGGGVSLFLRTKEKVLDAAITR